MTNKTQIALDEGRENAVEIFREGGTLAAILDQIDQDFVVFHSNVSTKIGQDEAREYARELALFQAELARMSKDLNEDLQAQINRNIQARLKMEGRLTTVQKAVLVSLTGLENTEKPAKNKIQAEITGICTIAGGARQKLKEAEDRVEQEKQSAIQMAQLIEEKVVREKAESDRRVQEAETRCDFLRDTLQNRIVKEAENRKQAESDRRASDRQHRDLVNQEVHDATEEIITEYGSADDIAGRIVAALITGEIPHVPPINYRGSS